MSELKKMTDAAMKREKADIVIKNAKYLNVFTNEFVCGEDIAISEGRFVGFGSYEGKAVVDAGGKTIVPGFIDGHVHIESSMVTPAGFARAACAHGTSAIVADPHEIANVCGTDGLDYMIEASRNLPIDIFFMVPSCVPATYVDEAGATLNAEDIAEYLDKERVLGLAEMMNAVGVVNGDPEVLAKTDAARERGKLIDGHAPLLSGDALCAYLAAGITSDHECTLLEEAKEKLSRGQWIMIREGTATRDLPSLVSLICEKYYSRCMFVTDDRSIRDLLTMGHIDLIVRRAIALGAPAELAYKTASFNTASRFGLRDRGAIAPGHIADFCIVDDVNDVSVSAVYKRGKLVSENGSVPDIAEPPVEKKLLDKVCGSVHCREFTPKDFEYDAPKGVIGLTPGSLVTDYAGKTDGVDVQNGIVKICVVERHKNTGHIGKAYIKGSGLVRGALALSVAHDSHNIVVAGTNDADIAAAVNHIREMNGGITISVDGKTVCDLPLEVAGLMTAHDIFETSDRLERLVAAVCEIGIGSELDQTMVLSFMSLVVIPHIKLTTLGLFDYDSFSLME